MVLELVAALVGYVTLQLLNPFIAKLDYIASLKADHVVMMCAVS